MRDWEIKIGFNLLPAKSLLRDIHVVPGSCSLSHFCSPPLLAPASQQTPGGPMLLSLLVANSEVTCPPALQASVTSRSLCLFFPSSREREVVVSHLILRSVPSHKKSSSCRRALFLVEWDFWASRLPKLTRYQMLFCVVTGSPCPHLSHACHLT